MTKHHLTDKGKVTLISALGACLLLAVIYLGGLIFYSYHFLPKTTINDIKVSGMNVSKANEALKELSPTLSIIEQDKDPDKEPITETLNTRDLDQEISYDSSALLNSQNKLGWFVSMFKKKDLSCNKISGSFNKAKIKASISDFYFMNPDNIIMPENASLSAENGKVVIHNAVNGSYIDEQTVIDLIAERLNDFIEGKGNDTLDLNDHYIRPTFREDDPSFRDIIDNAEQTLNKTITLNITSDDSIRLQSNEIGDLLKYEDDHFTYDQDKLSQYIHDFYNEHINDQSGYISRSALQNDLSKALDSSSDETVSIEWQTSPNIGRIEVTINEQRMDYYEDEVLILSSPIVSGNGEITDETIHGKYEVRRMSTDTYLMGRDYLEHVDYWMGFDESGRVYGLHDASWRDEFGGDIWLYDPSRGCVNMPTDKIAILFEYAQLGTEVYVHD